VLFKTGTAITALKFGILGAALKARAMQARRMPNSEKNAQSRTIRVHLGEPLKAYYDEMQHAQPDDRLAKLMQYLSEQLEAENSGAK
jgi:hypothetical protein